MSEVNQQGAGGATREEFEKRVEAFAGNSEFMRFLAAYDLLGLVTSITGVRRDVNALYETCVLW